MSKATASGVYPSLQALAAFVLVVVVLYFGRPVLLPVGFAALGAFLLTPAIKFLERRRVPRIVAVLIVAICFLGHVVGFSLIVAAEMRSFATRLPEYRQNLSGRLDQFRVRDGWINRMNQVLTDVTQSIENPGGAGAAPDPSVPDAELSAPVADPVRVIDKSAGPLDRLRALAQVVVTPLANIGIVLVLMVFVLLNREDLRNRVVRLSGSQFALTTRTLDDLATRISRYLVATALVNGSYGAVVAIGLWLIGIEHAVVWGLIAGLMRFIPYIGPTVGIALPLGMAFIQFPASDWGHLIAAAAFLGVLETLTNVVIEPLTYGYSIGVSIVALLVAALFWSWLWGPLGLLLSVPITVTLVVLGEYIPSLEVLAVILGDKPALDDHAIYYQRLLAGDIDEAESILDEEVAEVGLLEAYDAIAVRAVNMAERDLHNGKVTTPEHDSVVDATREYIEEHSPQLETRPDAPADAPRLRVRIIGCPVRDTGDEMALEVLRQQWPADEAEAFEILSSKTLAAEMLARIEEGRPDVVCLSSLGPLGLRPLRYLTKRIRMADPYIRIVVGNWGYRSKDSDRMTSRLKQCGADVVFTSLSATHEYFQGLAPRVVMTGSERIAAPEPATASSA
jgi:predicted PurR-regulated permease PerM